MLYQVSPRSGGMILGHQQSGRAAVGLSMQYDKQMPKMWRGSRVNLLVLRFLRSFSRTRSLIWACRAWTTCTPLDDWARSFRTSVCALLT